MLARSSKLRHPSGIMIETPLLVPSFSSKGFKFFIIEDKYVSEITQKLEITSEFLSESMLVSAYDIYYNYTPIEYCHSPQVIFVDSGGYETADDHDMSTVLKYTTEIKPWDEKMLQEVLDKFPDHVVAVFVSFDHGSVRKPLKEQIKDARSLFAKYPGHLHDFLIKPEQLQDIYIDLPNIIRSIEDLGGFDVIGVTEKELGNSLLDRMYNIAKIRRALDEVKINSPIHVFGSLDPITSCLYYLSGAEIFDGLTWLRYSYHNSMAIYSHNYSAVELGIHVKNNQVEYSSIVNNTFYLQKLQYQMKDFLLQEDYTKFENIGDFLKRSYDTLCTKLGGRY